MLRKGPVVSYDFGESEAPFFVGNGKQKLESESSRLRQTRLETAIPKLQC